MSDTFVGESLPRLEDERLVRGQGGYTDDIGHGAAEAAFVRSEFAHARILEIDVSDALEVEGVLAIYTYDDLSGHVAEPLPLLIPHPGLIAPRTQLALASDEVCYVGQTIMMVLARDRYIAEDAVAAVRVSYEPLPAVVDLTAALEGDTAAHEDSSDNLAGRFAEEKGDVESALATAPHSFTWRLEVERSAGMPMEGRAVHAHYDPVDGHLLVFDSTQAPTSIRAGLVALLGIDGDAIDVVAPDIGGGFGTKIMQFYPEEVLIPWAALRLKRSVKWTEDRREHFIGSNHERRQVHDVRVGCDRGGRLLAFDTKFVHDTGAYCPYGLIVPINTATHLPGPYKLRNYSYRFDAVYTNTVPTSPYRGAGRPQAAFVMERVLDRIAVALGLDRADVRRRNFLQPREFPYDVGVTSQDGGPTIYDSGDYRRGFDLLLDTIDYAGFQALRTTEAEHGRQLGIGFACYVEGTGIGPYEGAVIKIHPDGRITAATGLSTQGQGHATILAQIAADVLGVRPEDVDVITGDTRRISYGVGTFASRAAVVAGNAVRAAAVEVRRQAQELAADLLEAAPEDIELRGGEAAVSGAPSSAIPLGQLATIANPLRYAFGEQAQRAVHLARRATHTGDRPLPEGRTPGLAATEYFSPNAGAYGFGVHGAVVEIDSETHSVLIRRYVVMHDCGRIINPMIVEGQVLGGLAQGIGGALYEKLAYDPDGQLQNASFMDFLMPFATETVRPSLVHTETPSPNNPLGIKGAGERQRHPGGPRDHQRGIRCPRGPDRPRATRAARSLRAVRTLIHVIATGGTIASLADPETGAVRPAVGATELVASIPGLEAFEPRVEEIAHVNGWNVTPDVMLAVAARAETALRDPGVAGAVVTHGTDTVEETAFLCDLLVSSEKPVVFAAAMRSGGELSADGPRNLLNAARVAAGPEAVGLGSVVVLNDELHAARWVRKQDTFRPGAFVSPDHGPLGLVTAAGLQVLQRPERVTPLERPAQLAHSVPIVQTYTAMEADVIEVVLDATRAAGLVVEGTGLGNVPGSAEAGIASAISRGIPVVLATRVPSGGTDAVYGGPGGGATMRTMGTISAQGLSAAKARLLLMVLLAQRRTGDEIADPFAAIAKALR